jgi:predicted aldo/keto reductase-like oxidoreductase
MLGILLKSYPRESFVISTKIHVGGMNDAGEFTSDTKPSEITKKFEISMERLGLEYVDILYLHAIETRQAAMYEPVLQAMSKIKKSGKARFLGVSTHTNMPQVLDAAVDSGVYDVVLTSYNYQMKDWKEMEVAIKRVADAGIGIIGMKSMAGGFKDKERTKRVNTKAALKWVLQNENIHTTIPGFTSFDQLEESFSVMEDLNLDQNDLNELFAENINDSLFCQGCKTCAGSCKKNLPVPDLMRAYMYTYGYRDHLKAQEVLFAENTVNSSFCSDCNDCTVNCAKGFDVAARITDVARLKEVPREFFS